MGNVSGGVREERYRQVKQVEEGVRERAGVGGMAPPSGPSRCRPRGGHLLDRYKTSAQRVVCRGRPPFQRLFKRVDFHLRRELRRDSGAAAAAGAAGGGGASVGGGEVLPGEPEPFLRAALAGVLALEALR